MKVKVTNLDTMKVYYLDDCLEAPRGTTKYSSVDRGAFHSKVRSICCGKTIYEKVRL